MSKSNSNKQWSPKDIEAAVKLAASSPTIEDALARIAKKFPERAVTRASIDTAFKRHNKPSLTALSRAASVSSKEKEQEIELVRFVEMAKKGGTLEELCDRLDQSPRAVRRLLTESRDAGYRFALKNGAIGSEPRRENIARVKKLVAEPTEQQAFAVCSDLHIGSKFCLEEQLVDFITRAAKEDGVKKFFVPGDLLDGCYRHSRWDEAYHGFEQQCDRMTVVLPQLPGVTYEGIAGNHDETFEKDSGIDVCRAINDRFRRAGRTDLTMHGARGAYFRYAPDGGRGVLIELWHPLGGGAYAVSYKLQRHVEEYGVGQKPDFVFAGHWHQQCYVVRRGVHCFLSGTFHGGGSSFSKALGGAQAIGGWVVKYKQTKGGAIRDVATTWRGYYENEQVRSLGLT